AFHRNLVLLEQGRAGRGELSVVVQCDLSGGVGNGGQVILLRDGIQVLGNLAEASYRNTVAGKHLPDVATVRELLQRLRIVNRALQNLPALRIGLAEHGSEKPAEIPFVKSGKRRRTAGRAQRPGGGI